MTAMLGLLMLAFAAMVNYAIGRFIGPVFSGSYRFPEQGNSTGRMSFR